MRIMIIEDDEKLAQFLKMGLSQDGFTVDAFLDGESAMKEFEVNEYDLVIVDWHLPGMDGIGVCKEIRNKRSSVPILFLTAQNTVDDKVKGLESGADDYLTKPFSFIELAARLQALLRRRRHPIETLSVDDLVMNVQERKVARGNRRIDLSNKEFAILELLLRNRNRLVTYTAIVNHVWEVDFDTGTNVVYVHIAQLRSKLKCGSRKPLIHTVKGAGYILRDPAES